MRRLAFILLVLAVACGAWAASSAGDDATAMGHARRLPRSTEARPGDVAVYVHAHLLGPGDRLQDGPDGTVLELENQTLLFWVDKEPQSRFVHPTAYVLVSGAGVAVVKGQWWPVLNGQRILFGKSSSGTMLSPVSVPTGDDAHILVHLYPEELEPGEVLADGEEPLAITSERTFFAWVDMMPAAYFTHPTVYILVTADGQVVVREGGWWPLLNGKKVLHGRLGTFGVPFPVWLR